MSFWWLPAFAYSLFVSLPWASFLPWYVSIPSLSASLPPCSSPRRLSPCPLLRLFPFSFLLASSACLCTCLCASLPPSPQRFGSSPRCLLLPYLPLCLSLASPVLFRFALFGLPPFWRLLFFLRIPSGVRRRLYRGWVRVILSLLRSLLPS